MKFIYLFPKTFIAEKVTTFYGMFSGFKSLLSLDLSGIVGNQVLSAENMFASCSSLQSLNLNNFEGIQTTNIDNMFYNSKN